MSIDLRHLQYFLAAAESRSFVKAAKLVNVSQPAITKSVQRLEKWFGHSLFERGTELTLTEFGKAIIVQAKKILAEFDELNETAGHFGTSWAGTLKIGAGPLVAEALVGAAIGKMLARNPALKVVIHVDNYAAFPAMLRDRRIDLFIADFTELTEAHDLTIQRLEPNRFQWFCRKGHPLAGAKSVSFSQVLVYPVVLPELPVWAREWFATNLPEGMAPSAANPPFHPSVICSHFSTLQSIVLGSDAVSALTELDLLREPYSSQFAVLKYAGATPSSNPGIVTLKKRTLSPASLMLIEEVTATSKGIRRK